MVMAVKRARNKNRTLFYSCIPRAKERGGCLHVGDECICLSRVRSSKRSNASKKNLH